MSQPRCPDLDLLSPYADGELPPTETAAVRRHVTTCDHCRRRLADLREIDGWLFEAARRRGRPRVLPLGLAAAAAGLLLTLWLALPPRTETESARVPTEEPGPVAARAGPTASERIEALVLAEIDGRRDPERPLRTLGFAARRHLRRKLEHEDPHVARAALRLTVEIRDRTSIPETITLLQREGLAAEAARALGDLGATTAAEALASAFRNETAPDATLEALVRIEADQILDSLLADEADLDRRALLLAACGRLPAYLGAPLLARHLDSPRAGELLAASRAEVVPILRRRLADGDPHAAHALGILKDEDSLPRLVGLLGDPALRGTGARALAALGTDPALEALIAAAGDTTEDPVVLVLGRMGVDGPLADRFESGRHRERRRAVRLMGLCGGEPSLPSLEDALTDPALADEAVRALGRLGVRHSGAVAILAHAGKAPALRVRVIRALGETGRSEAVTALGDLAVDLATTRAAVAALGNIPDDEAIRALLTLKERPRFEAAALRALGRPPADRVKPPRPSRGRNGPPARPRIWPEI